MKLSIICFSLTGLHTSERLKQGLEGRGHTVVLAKKSKYLEDSIKESAGCWTEKRFVQDDGIIFVGACGIAVRSIAPFVASKKSDPAVLVIDECGQFVISLLSGHLGGANALALEAASILKAQPVVTTATDLHNRFAVDVFAKKNGCEIINMKTAKEVSAALLAGEQVGFYSEFPWKGVLPEGLVLCDQDGIPAAEEDLPHGAPGAAKQNRISENPGEKKRPHVGIAVTVHSSCMPFPSTVQIVPPVVTLGMGCRKGKEADAVYEAAKACLERASVYRKAVERLASIDLKKEEEGLLALAARWEIPFSVFSEEELLKARGEFTSSAFVKSITGVENVCERSAVTAAAQGILIEKKYGANGVTTALAVRKWEVRFE
ncbi:MAG TPA: cobalt-precorrin 5A hydrolase [Candidatus Blautia intestinavium]|nr:cobalt-precorrin 5A hydrolase [Candidatus Blautia intestinavium]